MNLHMTIDERYQLFQQFRKVFKSWKLYLEALAIIRNQQYTSRSQVFLSDLVTLYLSIESNNARNK